MGLRKLTITVDLLVEILKGFWGGAVNYFVVRENAIPVDAQIVSVRQSAYRPDQIDVTLQSAEFSADEDMEPITPHIASVDAEAVRDGIRRLEEMEANKIRITDATHATALDDEFRTYEKRTPPRADGGLVVPERAAAFLEMMSDRNWPPSVNVTIEADRILLKVSTFAADLDGTGHGSVTVDGRPLKVVRMLVEADPDNMPKIQLDLLCTESKQMTDLAVCQIQPAAHP